MAGVGQNCSTISSIVRANVKSQSSNYSLVCSFLVDKITIKIYFEIPSHIKLADPNFNISRPVDILIGAEIFYSLFCIRQFKL